MNRLYSVLVKATLAAAVALAVVSVGAAIMMETAGLMPLLALAAVSGVYAGIRITRHST